MLFFLPKPKQVSAAMAISAIVQRVRNRVRSFLSARFNGYFSFFSLCLFELVVSGRPQCMRVTIQHHFTEIHYTVKVDADKVDFLFHDVPRNGTLAGKRIGKVGPFYFLQTPNTSFAFHFRQYEYQ